jgi:hypothetical protein
VPVELANDASAEERPLQRRVPGVPTTDGPRMQIDL